jgi:hypothetical protein
MGERGARGKRDRHLEERGVQELADYAIHWIRLTAIVLGAAVGYLEFRDAQLRGFAQAVDNTTLIKVGLVIYFIGLGWGALDDTRIQKCGYRNDPDLGRIGFKERVGIALFVGLFVSLFFIPSRSGWFQLIVLSLIAVNFWTWRVIFDRTRSVVDATYKACAKGAGSRNTASLAKLLLVVEYMNGPWQRRRFFTLIGLAAVQVPLAFLVASGRLAPLVAGRGFFGVPGEVLIGYLPGALFITYVLISEIWMKVFRVRIFSDLTTIDWVEAHFTLGRQRDCPLPQPHMGGMFDFSPPSNANYGGHGPLRWYTSNS